MKLILQLSQRILPALYNSALTAQAAVMLPLCSDRILLKMPDWQLYAYAYNSYSPFPFHIHFLPSFPQQKKTCCPFTLSFYAVKDLSHFRTHNTFCNGNTYLFASLTIGGGRGGRRGIFGVIWRHVVNMAL